MAIKPITVSQLNGYIHRVLQTDPVLGNVTVRGEISNLKFHSSGHVYFSLKDDGSKINCFLAAQNLAHIKCDLDEGMEITAAGYVSVYQRGGYYSLNIRDIETQGVGDLAIRFEKLKKKLADEGLLDKSQKKELPAFPKKVAVITASTGAAVQDIIKIITNKNDYVDVMLFPVLVQGPGAAHDISRALDTVNREFPDTDVIITGRGGGSIEDLWAFNEEEVARSIYASDIPVISGVGHEIDFTIADLVADKRAETPTAAADMAVPDTGEIRMRLDELREDLDEDLDRYIIRAEESLNAFGMNALRMRLIERTERYYIRSKALMDGMKNSMRRIFSEKEHGMELMKQKLETLDPKSIISRGYGAILDKDMKMVTSAKMMEHGDLLRIVLSDGDADVTVDEVRRKMDG